uniref:Uncharacterized protein n=1 Tax=Oryza glaberrima TaxID=4538 RepID=I1PIB4_ORYGL
MRARAAGSLDGLAVAHGVVPACPWLARGARCVRPNPHAPPARAAWDGRSQPAPSDTQRAVGGGRSSPRPLGRENGLMLRN